MEFQPVTVSLASWFLVPSSAIQGLLGKIWIRPKLHEERQGTEPPLVGVRRWQKWWACSLKTWPQLLDSGGCLRRLPDASAAAAGLLRCQQQPCSSAAGSSAVSSTANNSLIYYRGEESGDWGALFLGESLAPASPAFPDGLWTYPFLIRVLFTETYWGGWCCQQLNPN